MALFLLNIKNMNNTKKASLYEFTLNQCNDGIVITNSNDQILYVNQQILYLTQKSKDQIIGKDVSLFVKQNNNDMLNEGLLLGKSSQEIPIEINISKLSEKENFKQIWIIKDIRERKFSEIKILAATIEAENKERISLSEELHDDLGPILSSIKYYTSLIQNEDSAEENLENIKLISELVNESIKITKIISNNLNPITLNSFGLEKALKNYCEKLIHKIKIKISVQNNTFIFYNKSNEITLFRILKELINNSIKHSFANQIEIKFKNTKNQFEVFYCDNGIGFDINQELQKKNKKMGLLNIISRVKTLGGSIKIPEGYSSGFIIEFSFNKECLI